MKHFSKLKVFTVGSLVALGAFILIHPGHGDGTEKPFSDVQDALEARLNAIHSATAYFNIDNYNSAAVVNNHMASEKKVYDEAVQTGQIQDQKVPLYVGDPNSSVGYFWSADAVRWKCQRIQFYPEKIVEGRPTMDSASFDGEKLYTYNDFNRTGIISGTEDTAAFIGNIKNNSWLSFAVMLGHFEDLKAVNEQFKFVKSTQIEGEDCLIYELAMTSDGGKGHLTLAVSPKLGYLPIRFEERFQSGVGDTSKGNLTIFTCQSSLKSGDFYFPKTAKREHYSVSKDGNLTWDGTQFFTMSKIDVNVKPSSNFFAERFPPGTLVEDRIESPGQPKVVGAEPAQAVNMMKNHVEPPREYKNGTKLPLL